MGALALIIMGRLPVSVYQHTVATSVRMVSTLAITRWTLVKSGLQLTTGVQPPHCWSPRLSFVLLSDLERCELGWDKFQGFCYRHFSQRLSWEVAEQHCRMLGAHLVSVMSPEEQTYINSTSRSCCTAPYVWKICWAHLFFCPQQETIKSTSGLVWMIKQLRMTSAGLTGTRWYAARVNITYQLQTWHG